MSEEVRYRLYGKGDESEIVELLTGVFGKWPQIDVDCSPIEYWRWKYLGNPRRDNLNVVAECDDKIVGCYHVIPLNIKIRESVHFCFTNVDLAVHPEYRQRGIMVGLREYKNRQALSLGARAGYHITGNPILLRRNLRVNKLFPFRIANLVRIRDIDLHLEKMPVREGTVKKAGFLALKTLNRLNSALRIHGDEQGSFETREINGFDERYDRLWERLAPNYDFIIDRTGEYMNWRYSDPRIGGYTVRIAEDDSGELVGYCVSRVNSFREDYPIGYIVDLQVVPGKTKALERLIAETLVGYDEAGVNIVLCQLIKNHRHSSTLKKLGFLDSRVNFHMSYSHLGDHDVFSEIENADPSRVCISWGGS